jgi:hypothetical protein
MWTLKRTVSRDFSPSVFYVNLLLLILIYPNPNPPNIQYTPKLDFEFFRIFAKILNFSGVSPVSTIPAKQRVLLYVVGWFFCLLNGGCLEVISKESLLFYWLSLKRLWRFVKCSDNNDTGNACITGVIDNSEACIAGFNNTGKVVDVYLAV